MVLTVILLRCYLKGFCSPSQKPCARQNEGGTSLYGAAQALEGMLVEEVLLCSSPLPGAKALSLAAFKGKEGTFSLSLQSNEHATSVNEHHSLAFEGRSTQLFSFKRVQVAFPLGDEP